MQRPFAILLQLPEVEDRIILLMFVLLFFHSDVLRHKLDLLLSLRKQKQEVGAL